MKGSVAERFAQAYEPEPNSGCWLWSACKLAYGYGLFTYDGRLRTAHRVSWLISGRTLTDEDCVLHKCDTPACVNPDHLFVGTQAENMADKVRKDRAAKGTRNGSAKLTPTNVAEIRRRLADGERQRRIAADYGVGQALISSISRKALWGWLEN